MRSSRALAAEVVDALAEAAVVPGFSRVGIALRRRLEAWGDPPSMAGEVAVVTGSTSGVGLATATAMAGLGATVHLVGRDAERGRQAVAAVEAAGGGSPRLDLVDMSDPGAVADFGRRLAERYDSLGVLVHNAGALSRAYRQSPAGMESTVATQVLGPYVLTAAVAPLLWKDPPGRIVTVSSGGMYAERFDLDALEMPRDGYDGVTAYARAKRAQVVLAQGWADRLGGGVASYSMHPGWVDTPGLKSGLPGFRALLRPLLRSPEQGADTVVWLSAGGSAEPAGGSTTQATSGLFHDRRRRSEGRFPISRPTRPGDPERLLAFCAARTGVETPTRVAAGT
jgi:dehydrogenase/reductase SDR family protein 12